MVLLMLNETIIFLTMVRSHWRGWHIVLFAGGKRARRSRGDSQIGRVRSLHLLAGVKKKKAHSDPSCGWKIVRVRLQLRLSREAGSKSAVSDVGLVVVARWTI